MNLILALQFDVVLVIRLLLYYRQRVQKQGRVSKPDQYFMMESDDLFEQFLLEYA